MKNSKIKLSLLAFMSIALVGCGNKTSETPADSGKTDGATSESTSEAELTGVAKVIKDAEGMHYDEIVTKAKEEVGDGEVKIFGNSSSIEKACTSFTELTGIKFTYTKVGDSDLYKDLSASIPAGTYTADFVFCQDANMMKTTMLDKGYLLNYTPLDYKDVLSSDDLNPTGGIAFNKVFMYNNTDYDGTNADTASAGKVTNLLTNVWQVAGTNADEGHISGVSFKDPDQELINKNMLIMLTAPKYVEKLTEAYKAYYGKDYAGDDDYENIGYKFIAEFLNNTVAHSSDGTECKNLAAGLSSKMAYVNYNKVKDCKGSGVGAEDAANLTIAAMETEVKGFAGFVYKMYPLIPQNAKYPYAACAFENYILSENGYQSGWTGMKGYYSVNPNNAVADGDKELSWWKGCCVVEDASYITENYDEVSEFISTNKKA